MPQLHRSNTEDYYRRALTGAVRRPIQTPTTVLNKTAQSDKVPSLRRVKKLWQDEIKSNDTS
jgi:hypothetical protein